MSLNGVAVLNEERFLSRIGYSKVDSASHSILKTQAINFIQSVKTVLTYPLMIVNTLVIVAELLFG